METIRPKRGLAEPRVDKVIEEAGSSYAAVQIAAKRARQINSYNRAVREGTVDESSLEMTAPPMVAIEGAGDLTIAMQELAQGKLNHTNPTGDEGQELYE